MKDTKKILRTAIYTALNGNITYSGNPVPVVDEKLRNSVSSNLFIILSTQSEVAEQRNSSVWITTSSIDIEIVHKTATEVSKDAVDDVYEDMLEIIFPTIGTIGISEPTGFQFLEGFRESCITQLLDVSQTESVLVSRVRLTFLITEK